MIKLVKRIFGMEITVDDLVAPLNNITIQLEALAKKHEQKIADQTAKIQQMLEHNSSLQDAKARASKVKASIDNLLGL